MVGLVNFAQFIGVWLLIGFSGNAADRYDRRKLLILTQLLSCVAAVVLGSLTLLNRATVPAVLVCAFILGILVALAVPTNQAYITSLVPRADLRSAVVLQSVTFNLARAVGPPLASLVVAALGLAWAFLLNGVSYLALAGGALVTRPLQPLRGARDRSTIRENLHYVRQRPIIRDAMIAVTIVSFATDPLTTLTPAFAQAALGRSDVFSGVLVGCFGFGAVVAAFVVMRRNEPTLRRVGGTALILGGGMVLFGTAHTLVTAIVGLTIAGFGYLATLTASTTMVQASIADAVRGRVMAVWSLGFLGIRPFAAIIDGWIAGWAGLTPAIVTMALPSLVLGSVLLLRRSQAS